MYIISFKWVCYLLMEWLQINYLSNNKVIFQLKIIKIITRYQINKIKIDYKRNLIPILLDS